MFGYGEPAQPEMPSIQPLAPEELERMRAAAVMSGDRGKADRIDEVNRLRREFGGPDQALRAATTDAEIASRDLDQQMLGNKPSSWRDYNPFDIVGGMLQSPAANSIQGGVDRVRGR